ncbi:MAG: hypothetical protein AAFO69_13885, partial [Bacteroidota bacterium]
MIKIVSLSNFDIQCFVVEKKALVFIAILSFFLLGNAQVANAQRFKKGYVVSDEGDTTRYAIDLSSGVGGRSSVTVRDGQITRQLSARKVRAFGFDNGSVFESSSFFPIAEQRLADFDKDLLINHVFYPLMVKGEVSLYKYNDKYIAMTNDDMVELKYEYDVKTIEQTINTGTGARLI